MSEATIGNEAVPASDDEPEELLEEGDQCVECRGIIKKDLGCTRMCSGANMRKGYAMFMRGKAAKRKKSDKDKADRVATSMSAAEMAALDTAANQQRRLQKKMRGDAAVAQCASPAPTPGSAAPGSAAASTSNVAAGTDQHSLDQIETELRLKKINARHEAQRAAILDAKDGDTAAAEAADKCTVCESDSCMARVSYRFGWFHYAILSEECPEDDGSVNVDTLRSACRKICFRNISLECGYRERTQLPACLVKQVRVKYPSRSGKYLGYIGESGNAMEYPEVEALPDGASLLDFDAASGDEAAAAGEALLQDTTGLVSDVP